MGAPKTDAMTDTDQDQSALLRNLWYLAVPGHHLSRGKHLKKLLLGEPLLLGRSNAGEVFALRDICPHRAIPLSYGTFDGTNIECAYHGWRFGIDGVCTHVPSVTEGQTLDVSKIRVRSYPCKEVQGNIWVYMSDTTTRPDEALPPIPEIPSIGDVPYKLAESVEFPCAIDHAVVGLMDPAHGPFVHRAWWWRTKKSMHEKAKAFGPSHLGFTMLRHRPSSNSRAYKILGGTPETQISFQLPGVRIEHVRAGKHQFCGLTAVTPIDAQRTEIHHLIYWTMPWLTLTRPLLRPFARAFLNQDRRVVERQQEGLAHQSRLMLIRDADTQARWYYQLKREFSLAREQARSFVNPVPEVTLRWRS
jgi:phenylpropionate dioxygenase-like ring-hydroxylating dioxygenase large terminal subunit